MDALRALEINSVIAENGRTVRRRRHKSRFRMARQVLKTEDAPVDLYRFSVARERAYHVMQAVIDAAGMDGPGHGTIFVQHVDEYVEPDTGGPSPDGLDTSGESLLLHDLSLMTCVLSTTGSGERLAETALELGTGVPTVTYGTGTGMRDRLGLLRITVPPEKELVHLLVPSIDADGLLHQLVEEGRLDRPGSGFVYCTAVQAGVLDTRLLIGPQEHAASMEQVVAAIDKLSTGTAWRRRFSTDDGVRYRLQRNHREIAIVCAEERSGVYVDAALQAGAGGATSSRIRKLQTNTIAAGDAARERCIISVPEPAAERVIQAILHAAPETPDWIDSLQSLITPVAYSYQPSVRRR
ncbi:MAG: hypothetical protein EA382_08140 [Spirochaetaceae bacterium]|nr:MAG: hypothetical protein EA382_08140 [Spirochaetaceae bacterium]